MADASDIAEVRRNVNESTIETYTDEVIGSFVDAHGIAGSSAAIWREKAAKYADLVTVSESGASHHYSDLHKNALAMAKYWQSIADGELLLPVTPDVQRVHVKRIVRS